MMKVFGDLNKFHLKKKSTYDSSLVHEFLLWFLFLQSNVHRLLEFHLHSILAVNTTEPRRPPENVALGSHTHPPTPTPSR